MDQQPPNWQQGPPQQPPQPPLKKSRRRLWIILAIIGGLLVLSCATCGIVAALVPPTKQAIQPTQAPSIAVATATSTQAPTATDTPQPSPTATATPTPKPKPTTGATNVNAITHGTPHLGGPISDFYGKYGSQIAGDVQSGSAPNGSPDSSVGWITDSNNAYFLAVHYYTPSNIVHYITYAGPSDWSKAQYRDFMLTFAPPGTAENVSANQAWQQGGGDPYNPIAYTSSIGNFFIHINSGSGDMNTV
jgi:hypothetical protein